MKNFLKIVIIICLSTLCGIFGGIISNNQLYPVILSYLQSKDVKNTDETKIIKEKYIEQSAIIDAVKKVGPSVVSIVATKEYINIMNDPFYYFRIDPNFNFDNFNIPENSITKQKVGGGSGFIFDKRGYILTNKHVISDNNAEYTVTTYSGKKYKAQIIGVDKLNDVAVLKIDAEEDLTVAEIGNSDDVQVGQQVIAIGYALAQYDNTVTTGVISAKGRQISALGNLYVETLNNLFQTDAAINPGNSGGPLVNLNGQVIAINTAVDMSASGIGFAIPINDVKVIIDSVLKYGKIKRPFIGIRYILINENNAKDFGLPYDYGALITGNRMEPGIIPNGPADKAGLKEGDLIISINDIKLNNANLSSIISRFKIGDIIKLKIYRNNQELDINVKIGEMM